MFDAYPHRPLRERGKPGPRCFRAFVCAGEGCRTCRSLAPHGRDNVPDLVDAYGEQLVPGTNIAGGRPMEGLRVIPSPGHALHHDAYAYRSMRGVVLFPGRGGGRPI